MTERDWLTSTDVDPLLKWLQKSKRHRPTRRKLTLFACACASRLGKRVKDALTVRGLSLAERMADGVAGAREIKTFHAEHLHHKSDYIHIAVWTVRVMEPERNRTSPETSAESPLGIWWHVGSRRPASNADSSGTFLAAMYRHTVQPFAAQLAPLAKPSTRNDVRENAHLADGWSGVTGVKPWHPSAPSARGCRSRPYLGKGEFHHEHRDMAEN